MESLDENDQILLSEMNGISLSGDESRENNLDTGADPELPRSIIVTNVNLLVFDNDEMKVILEFTKII